jgi:ribosomal protein S13
MDLKETYDYIAALLVSAANQPAGDDDPFGEQLAEIALISQARVVLDILEAQAVHSLRNSLPQASYTDIGDAQGISKQASRIRHTKLEQVLKVHQYDGRRHSMSKAVVPPRHRKAAKPVRATRRTGSTE